MMSPIFADVPAWEPSALATTLTGSFFLAGLVLVVAALLPKLREYTATSTLTLIAGAGLMLIPVFGLGYALNPFGVFSEFLDHSDTTMFRLYSILFRTVVAIVLFGFFALVEWRLIGNLAFAAACTLFVWIGFDAVEWSGPERLEPNPVAAAEQGFTVGEVQMALDAATWVALERRRGEASVADISTILARRADTSDAAVQIASAQQGFNRYALYLQMHLAQFEGSALDVPLAGLLRTNSWIDFTPQHWGLIGVFLLLLVVGWLVFFRISPVNWFSATMFLLGGVGLLAVFYVAIDALNPRAWHGLLGVSNPNVLIGREGRLEWASMPELWVILIAVAIGVLFVGGVYSRERRTAGPGTKLLLISLRLGAIALILLALFEPTLRIQHTTAQHSHVLVLLDTSASMNQVDLYANRLVEMENGNRRERTFIRSEASRHGYGQFILDRLALASVQKRPTETATAPAFSRVPIDSGDVELQGILNQLSTHETQAQQPTFSRELADKLRHGYRDLALDFVKTFAPDHARPGSTVIRALEGGEFEAIDALIDTGTPVPPIAAFYMRLVRSLYEKNEALISAAALDAEEFSAGRHDSLLVTADEDDATDPISMPDDPDETDSSIRALPARLPEFGPMDNFVLELQLRRVLRLYELAEQLSETWLDFPRYRALFTANRELDELIARRELATTDVALARLHEARELKARVEDELAKLTPTHPDRAVLFRAVMDKLIVTAEGMRRIDIALELLHPHAQLGALIGPEPFQVITRLRAKQKVNEKELTNTLHLRTFAERLHPHPLPTSDDEMLAEALDRLEATGLGTAIGVSAQEALSDLLKRHVRPDHVGGVVMISDGINNLGSPRAMALNRLQVDTVAIGSRDSLKKLELFGLSGPHKIAKGSKLNLAARIRADRAYQVDDANMPGGKNVEIVLCRVVPDPTSPTGEKEILIPWSNRDRIEDKTLYADNRPPLPNIVQAGSSGQQFVRLVPVTSTQDLTIEIDPRQDEAGIPGHFVQYNVPVRLRLKINHEKYVDEDTYRDNYRDIWVTFTDKKTTVLYIDGRPRYEFRYLATLLQRDPTIRFQAWLEKADHGWPQPRSNFVDPDEPPVEALTRIPPANTEEERKKFFDTYDVVIIGDVSQADLGDAFCQMLEQFVAEHRGGVIFVAGQFYNPLSYVGSHLELLVPMKLYGDSAQKIYPQLVKGYQLTNEDMVDQLLMLDPNPQTNRRLWEGGVHGFYWFHPIPEPKEGALVLARHPGRVSWGSGDSQQFDLVQTSGGENYPLFVFSQYGKGAVLYLGTDDLWYIRARQQPPDRYYRPLWTQFITYMASRKRESDDETMEVYTKNRNNPVYTYPDRIEIEGSIRGDNTLRRLRELGALQTRPDGTSVLQVVIKNTSLRSAMQDERELVGSTTSGLFRGEFLPPNTGNYEVWIKGEPSTTHLFQVIPSRDETTPLPMNLSLLAEIAQGRPGEIRKRPHVHLPPQAPQLRVDPLELDDDAFGITEELGDAPLIFILVAFLLGFEWIIRKRTRLL